MRVNCMLGVIGLAVLLPTAAAAQDTTYDYDKTAPFAQYRTYAFKDGTSTGDRLIDARIVAALESELAVRGLTKATATPDLGTKQVDTDADPEKRDTAIAKAVARIMKHYPPRADQS